MNTPSDPIRFRDLPAPWATLIRVMQRLNFGRIENLSFHDGSPDLESDCRIIREIKIGGDNHARKEVSVDDFVLCGAHAQLMDELDEQQDGVVRSLTVKHGLPFLVEMES